MENVADSVITKLVLGLALVALAATAFQVSAVLNLSKSLSLSGCCIYSILKLMASADEKVPIIWVDLQSLAMESYCLDSIT